MDVAIRQGHSEIVQLIKHHGEACGITPPEDYPDFYSTNDPVAEIIRVVMLETHHLVVEN